MILVILLGIAVMAFITSVVCENQTLATIPEDRKNPHLSDWTRGDLWLGDTGEDGFLSHERIAPRAARSFDGTAFLVAWNPGSGGRPENRADGQPNKSRDQR